MNHKIKFILLTGVFTLLSISCTKDLIVPIDYNNLEVSFSDHVLPKIEDGCSASSCHGGAKSPNLSEDVYEVLLDGNYISTDTSKATNSRLYKTLNGTHNDGRISDDTKNALEAWMKQGAKNN